MGQTTQGGESSGSYANAPSQSCAQAKSSTESSLGMVSGQLGSALPNHRDHGGQAAGTLGGRGCQVGICKKWEKDEKQALILKPQPWGSSLRNVKRFSEKRGVLYHLPPKLVLWGWRGWGRAVGKKTQAANTGEYRPPRRQGIQLPCADLSRRGRPDRQHPPGTLVWGGEICHQALLWTSLLPGT